MRLRRYRCGCIARRSPASAVAARRIPDGLRVRPHEGIVSPALQLFSTGAVDKLKIPPVVGHPHPRNTPALSNHTLYHGNHSRSTNSARMCPSHMAARGLFADRGVNIGTYKNAPGFFGNCPKKRGVYMAQPSVTGCSGSVAGVSTGSGAGVGVLST